MKKLSKKDQAKLFLNSWRNFWVSAGLNPSKCTCVKCISNKTCEYVYDYYNFDGDCLREK